MSADVVANALACLAVLIWACGVAAIVTTSVRARWRWQFECFNCRDTYRTHTLHQMIELQRAHSKVCLS